MTKVESIKESDAEDLVELFGNAGPYVSARSQSDYWLYARLFSTTCLCIRDDNGKPVAALIAFIDQTPGVDEIYIQDIAIRPEFRGRGLATGMMTAIHDVAARSLKRRIWLTSEPENLKAISLWNRMGYQNLSADYKHNGIWITSDLKGPGRATGLKPSEKT